jgi:hypothetical protein
MDGTDGSQTFADSSTNNFTLTAFGNAQINTSIKKLGSGAAYFDGSGDYIEGPLNSAFDFGNDDFTVEFWFNTSNPNWQTLIARWGSGGNAFFIGIAQGSFGLQFYINNSLVIGGGTINLLQWHHVAACRSGGNLRLFLDGIQVGNTNNIGTTPINPTTESIRIGFDNNINPYIWMR